MPLLRRRGGDSAPTTRDDVVRDRAWDDPALDAVLDRVVDAPGSEAVDAALAHLATLRFQPERQVLATFAFEDHLTGALDEAVSRAEGARDDADAADALALLGLTLTTRAWEVRGSGRASGVSEEAFDEFHRLLRDADEILVRALARVPDHPSAATGRLRTALGLGAPEQEWAERFAAARQARSTLWHAHKLMLTGRCKKWYGSDDAMFGFARDVARNAPAGDPVVAVLPLAYIEYFLSVISSDVRRPGLVFGKAFNQGREEVMAAADRWCGNGTVPPHPHNAEAHQLFGWFFAGVKKDRARWHLERAGLRMSHLPWSFLGADPVEQFLETRRKAGLP